MKIFLIGLPGSGKSTLGKLLAENLQYRFIDLDQAIEAVAGKTIPEIFSQQGEEKFRELEHEALLAQMEVDSKFVMATGGGTPCFRDNMALMRKAGKTIFLDIPIREIVRRIKQTDRAERPLLGRIHPDELKVTIETLRTRRLPFYKMADIVVPSTQITVQEIMQRVNA